MKVIVDSLEKKPYWPSSLRQRLVVGDYTTPALLNQYHIERKSPQDLYGTLMRGKIRFLREIHRAVALGIKLDILVECTERVFIEKRWKNGELREGSPQALQAKIFRLKSMGVTFIWCSSRAAAKKKALQLLTTKQQLYATHSNRLRNSRT